VLKELRLEDRVRQEVEVLAREFEGTFGIETVQRCADEVVEGFHQAPVRDFIPLLVYRSTRERLRDAARASASSHGVPMMLFVCVENAGRSQMAAAFAHQIGVGNVLALSAGTRPASRVHDVVVEAMAEVGIDLSSARPTPFSDELAERARTIVTMGCGDACPVIPGKRYVDWQIDDPAGQPIEVVRRIRDELRERVRTLLLEVEAEAL
jgi:protein-tyrosine-phosphatase